MQKLWEMYQYRVKPEVEIIGTKKAIEYFKSIDFNKIHKIEYFEEYKEFVEYFEVNVDWWENELGSLFFSRYDGLDWSEYSPVFCRTNYMGIGIKNPVGFLFVDKFIQEIDLKTFVHMLNNIGANIITTSGHNSGFERKEYFETYIMEVKAREMIEEDPSLLDGFNQWKEANPELAQNQWLQLEWFYNRSLWADDRRYVYPVGRIVNQGVLEKLGK